MTAYSLGWWGFTAALLAGIIAMRIVTYQPPPRVEQYMRQVAEVVAATPTRFGDWVSTDAPVPTGAVAMLRANFTLSRRYTNLVSGQQAMFLLVQCRDARDLLGHYPPVCYPASGYKPVDRAERDWQFEGLTIEGKVYTFTSTHPGNLSSMIIYNFMILPDGTICRDMEGVNKAARDPRNRQLGAAQLQVLVDPTMPEADRETVFRALVQAHRPIIEAILAGGSS